jgi:hypothetical protein
MICVGGAVTSFLGKDFERAVRTRENPFGKKLCGYTFYSMQVIIGLLIVCNKLANG